MANPFLTQFDSDCNSCGDTVDEGDEMYACEGQFLCPSCADAGDYVCSCGNFKKSEYQTCYECSQSSPHEQS